ncbi:alpha/beta fold hydrolase [Marinobacterium arenosum]|uniref:alpha/beta fold hydrolase n=1 Tax=Marinobacterium arenosum TaxID=2862496 RepID=UPI001C970A17|nr:alpha/beta fold hydrolase [Marinobacterium arenosum]MBY4677817.1 alpha/beta hydrolase [Marinobacterium arenosum]
MIIDGRAENGRVVLAHGAGAPMDTEFMTNIAAGLAGIGLQVVRFEFPYMQKRREDGKKRPPDRMPKLLEAFRQVVEQLPQDGLPLWLAGKSMGGRVATMLAADGVGRGGWAFGYPFHPPGKPDNLRIEHLQSPARAIHIFQGSRDTMGDETEVAGYPLADRVQLHWLPDGNHDLKPRKASGYSQEQHLATVISQIKDIIECRT